MKAKELIRKLQKIVDKHGNVSIRVWEIDSDETGKIGTPAAGFHYVMATKDTKKIDSVIICDERTYRDEG